MLGSDFPDGRDLPPREGADLLRDVTPLLSRADIAFGNLEGPLCDGGKSAKKPGRNTHAFRTPTRFARHLRTAGFDVLSVANNHASDFGEFGRKSTRRVLSQQGIRHAGSDAADVARLKVKNTRIAVVAFATNSVSLNLNNIPAAREAVAEAARSADLVIVSFHGGAEGTAYQRVPRGPETYLRERRGDLRRFTHAVVDAGADLVLGHGPHVVRGMEVYRGRLIAYSLGNFATYGKFGLTGPLGLSLILEAHLSLPGGRFLKGRVHPMKQLKPGGPMPDERGSVIPVIANLSRLDFGPAAVRVDPDGIIAPPGKTP